MAFTLQDLEIDEVSLVDEPANPKAVMLIHKRNADVDKAEWDRAFINDLPDSSFAWIGPGGEKDDSGKTVPRSLRKLPYRDGGGNVDMAHLRSALSRLPQSDIPEADKGKIQSKLRSALEQANKSAATPPDKGGTDMEKVDALAAEVEQLKADAQKATESLEEVNKQLAAITEERDTLKKRVDEFDSTPEAIEKRKLNALPEDIRKRLEASEARIQKMEDEKLEQVYLAKAKALGQNEDFGRVMKRVSVNATTAEDLQEIERVIKALSEQAKSGKLFTTLGSDGNDGDVADEPDKAFLAKARKLREDNKDLSWNDACAQVAREDPDLYDRHRRSAATQSE
jgi:hypothetical protein